MNEQIVSELLTYFKQQKDAGYPLYYVVEPSNTSETKSPYTLPVSASERGGSFQDVYASTVSTSTAITDNSAQYQEKRNALVHLYYTVKNCHNCPLGHGRNKMVFGSGNATAPVMIIGEAPGEEEDLAGKPFVGRAGELLTKMLSAIHLNRDEDVFITNVIKCRPPKNRNPQQAELVSCISVIKKQISIIQPHVLLVLGRIAAFALLENSESIATLRLQNHSYNGIKTFVTYHPAALLRNPEYKKPAWEDLQRLQSFIKEHSLYGSKSY